MKKLLILLFFIPISIYAQKGNVFWDYPVKPGTDAWKSLKNNSEKVQVCQIPNDKLSVLKTPELLHICLNYPLLPDIFAFNNIKDGFGKFENDFNGFRKLLKRNDVVKELLKKYKTIDPVAIPADGSILEKGAYVLSLSYIELFISHPLIIEKLSKSEKKEIVIELLLKKEKKKHRPGWYQTTGIQTNYLVIVNK